MIITFCLEAICFLPDLRFLIKISGGFILLLWSKLVVSFKKRGYSEPKTALFRYNKNKEFFRISPFNMYTDHCGGLDSR